MKKLEKVQKLLIREEERLKAYKKSKIGHQYVLEQQERVIGIQMALVEIMS